MAKSKNLERVCAIVLIVSLLASAGLVHVKANGGKSTGQTMGYESRLFDTSRVHTIDIVMDGWDSFIENCESEEYSACAVVIDGESYKNVAIRAKGNTSLSSVRSLGSSRYSFKVEFDHYDDTKTYHGLDKLNLNNLIFDNTMMKDYLTYRMMAEFGVDAPLCSFVYITVNGEDFGLYLAVECIDDAFIERNLSTDGGFLYKPDGTGGMGGGRGGDQDDGFSDFTPPDMSDFGNMTPPDGFNMGDNAQNDETASDGTTPPDKPNDSADASAQTDGSTSNAPTPSDLPDGDFSDFTPPDENGGFMHVSGMTFEVNMATESSVVTDENGMFVEVSGARRVENALINGEPVDPEKTYTVASHNYMLKSAGDGFNMFQNDPILQDETMLDNQVLITYITEGLGGVVGEAYAEPYGQGRIVIHD